MKTLASGYDAWEKDLFDIASGAVYTNVWPTWNIRPGKNEIKPRVIERLAQL